MGDVSGIMMPAGDGPVGANGRRAEVGDAAAQRKVLLFSKKVRKCYLWRKDMIECVNERPWGPADSTSQPIIKKGAGATESIRPISMHSQLIM